MTDWLKVFASAAIVSGIYYVCTYPLRSSHVWPVIVASPQGMPRFGEPRSDPN